MKIKKILLINLSLLLITLLVAEFFSWLILSVKYKTSIENFNKITDSKISIPLMKYSKVQLPTKETLLSNIRDGKIVNNSKPPIILFGCSYTGGFGLKDDEIFAVKLADSAHRTVINRGKEGTGLPFLYYQLSQKDVVSKLPKNAEHIIFTLIPDHFPRLYRYRNFVLTGEHTLRYKIVEDKLVEDRPVFAPIHSLFSAILIEEYIANLKFNNRYNQLSADKQTNKQTTIPKNNWRLV